MDVFVAGLGECGVVNKGNTQDDFDSMEKETLVTKLQQVGFSLVNRTAMPAAYSMAWQICIDPRYLSAHRSLVSLQGMHIQT